MSDDAPPEAPEDPGRSQQYDRAMRALVRAAPDQLCQALGMKPEGPIQALSESFPARTRIPDVVLRIGEHRLLHLEYARRGERGLTPRMLVYRGLIMERFPADHLDQGVVVLGEGRLKGHDDFERNGFRLDLGILYLRDQDPEPFLAHHELAPLAVLTRGSQSERAVLLTRALLLIWEQAGDARAELLDAALVMATITLPRNTIDQAVRETGMSIESIVEFYKDFEFGRILIDQGLEKGRQQGRQEGRQELIADLLRARFGERPEIELLSRRLALQGGENAIKAITAASAIEELLP